jgi:predicted PurR-regulated permease PerM
MSGRQVFNATVIVLATLAVAYLLLKVGQVVIVLFIAIVFASTIRPVVDWLSQHRVPRGLAILLVYLALFAGIAGLIIATVPPLVGLTVDLFSGNLLIERVQTLAQRLAFLGWSQFRIRLPVVELPQALNTLLGEAGDTAQKMAWPVAQNTILVLSQIVLIFVMALYWLTAREPSLNLLLRMSPLKHRTLVEQVWTDVELTLGSYVRGQFILMVVIGLASLVGLLILRVPYAPALAVIAALTEAIPVVGPFLGGTVAVLVGLTVSGETALLVAGWYILMQQLENHILVPKVMERSVGLNPLVVIIALVIGGILKGVLGALLAVPVAGALQVIVRHLLIDPAIQSHELRTESGIVILSEEEPVETNGNGVILEDRG